MTMSNEHDIDVLNTLIEATLDSADGYREAAKIAEAPRFKAMFEARGANRQQLTADLQSEVRRLGGKPEADGTILASAERMFLNLKTMVMDNEQTVVNEVEAAEDHVKSAFEKALQDADLSIAAKAVVTKHYATVKMQHDEIRDLKREVQARAA
jgi:uncharacterized protein (TIGR02284 family)